MGTTTGRHGRVGLASGIAAALLVAAPSAAHADERPTVRTARNGTQTYVDPGLGGRPTRTVEGVLRRIAVDAPAAQTAGPATDPTVIVTRGGSVLPVDLDAPVRATDAPVTTRLVDGPALDAALAGRSAPSVAVESATVQPAATVAATPSAHRAYVAIVANSGTVASTAAVDTRVDAGLAWWKTEGGSAITSFARVGTTQRYTSALADKCGLGGGSGTSALWNEAGQKFPGVDFDDPGNHLVVIVAGTCGTSSTGIGSVGASLASGGQVTMVDDESIFTATIGHELGHNVSLDHANVCAGGCATGPGVEYRDLYSVMGLAITSDENFTPPALDSAYRDQLDITTSGETETVTAGQTVTRTLSPRSASTGLRGIEVQSSGTSYWVELRDGSGRDATTFYASGYTVGGSYSYPEGVTITRQTTDSQDVTVLQARSGGQGAYLAGQTFTAGDVSVSVNSVGSTASVTVSNAGAPTPQLQAGTPTVSGTARVGSTLTASPGTWSPTPTAYSYQWLADGTAIANATGTTFTPTATQLGQAISVRVRGTRSGYLENTATSGATGPVAQGVLTAGQPTVSGTARVGSTLTAATGTWSPTPSYAYQWLADDVAVSGATASTFVPTSAQVGAHLTVRVTGSKTGYGSTSASSTPTAAVGLRLLTASAPTITGTAKVGQRLGSSTGSWTSGTTFSRQWLADGQPIAGATGTSLSLGASLRGRVITLRLTGTQDGYDPATRTSKATAAVAAGTLTSSVPTISGTAKVGRRLTAARGSWSSGATFSYRWYADGKAISGATKTSLTLAKAQRGKRITVKVTGRKSGYTTLTRTSKATARVG